MAGAVDWHSLGAGDDDDGRTLILSPCHTLSHLFLMHNHTFLHHQLSYVFFCLLVLSTRSHPTQASSPLQMPPPLSSLTSLPLARKNTGSSDTPF